MGYFDPAFVGDWDRTPETPYPLSEKEVSGHRLYIPEIGRWLSRDPINESGFVFVVWSSSEALRAVLFPLPGAVGELRMKALLAVRRQKLVNHQEGSSFLAASIGGEPYLFLQNASELAVDFLGLVKLVDSCSGKCPSKFLDTDYASRKKCSGDCTVTTDYLIEDDIVAKGTCREIEFTGDAELGKRVALLGLCGEIPGKNTGIR